jgi:hypothetical protein
MYFRKETVYSEKKKSHIIFKNPGSGGGDGDDDGDRLFPF